VEREEYMRINRFEQEWETSSLSKEFLQVCLRFVPQRKQDDASNEFHQDKPKKELNESIDDELVGFLEGTMFLRA
jgi:hypothetical protein